MTGSREESGFALVEAILLVVILITPIVGLIGALAQVHRAGLAASAAAREAAVTSSRSTDGAGAQRAVRVALESAFADQGLSPELARLEMRGASALVRGGEVHVRVTYPVEVVHLPFVEPDPRIWVRATHMSEVDLYRSRGAAN